MRDKTETISPDAQIADDNNSTDAGPGNPPTFANFQSGEKPAPFTMQAEQDIEPERLVRGNIAWMLKLAERLLGDRGLAEDAVQDAFISAFKGLDKFEGRSSLKTWLHRITVNAALTKLRQAKRRAEQSIDEDQAEFDQYACRIEMPWHYLASLDEVLENDDLRKLVNDNINALPDTYRIVLHLRDIEGYDTREVAEQLEISEANVKVRLHRARSALKKRLEPILRGEVF
jgi:RNA polymerase sigma-70 factor (ECF subfamily)